MIILSLATLLVKTCYAVELLTREDKDCVVISQWYYAADEAAYEANIPAW